jgi:hypothetical protein
MIFEIIFIIKFREKYEYFAQSDPVDGNSDDSKAFSKHGLTLWALNM